MISCSSPSPQGNSEEHMPTHAQMEVQSYQHACAHTEMEVIGAHLN